MTDGRPGRKRLRVEVHEFSGEAFCRRAVVSGFALILPLPRSGKRVSKIFSRPGCLRAGVAAGSKGKGVAEAPRALGREAECRP